MAMTSISLFPPPLLSFSKHKSPRTSHNTHILRIPFTSHHSLSTRHPPKRTHLSQQFQQKKTQFWRTSAAPEEALPSDSIPVEGVPASDDGVGTVVSVLLFIAFVILAVLTIGVIYLGVTDFLQKREKEKFEKEEATKKKEGKKKGKVRARAGPRGFGQKIEEDDVAA